MSWPSILAITFTIIYLIDRIWKVAAITHFFHQPQEPMEPGKWPSLSLIQPVTASPNDLRSVLTSRTACTAIYPGPLEQIIIFDALDTTSQALCRELMLQFPEWQPKIVLTDSPTKVAIKTVKQLAGLKLTTAQILCFIDDDILLRAGTLPTLVRHLQPGIGATFGLACYTNWENIWGGLMSAFVNANALLNYIPLTYLIDPYTITGHIYALKRTDFEAIGGLTGMETRLDDDHELARRVLRAGLRNRQTPALYNVDNELPTLRAFMDQMKRWFVFPRELMLPGTPLRQQISTFFTSLPNLLPTLVLLLSVVSSPARLALAVCLAVFFAVYFWSEHRYLREVPAPSMQQPLRSKIIMPNLGWPLLLLVALVLPFQILFLLFSDNTIRWRGQKIQVKHNGNYELID
ncbi:MAG: glycosyltransferase [Chloroflexota bacterium]